VENPTLGVYPDLDTFYRVGVPMVKEVRREALMAFEDTDQHTYKKMKIE
jgi:hypothetical protein